MFPASLRLTKKDFESLKTRIVYRGELFDVAKKDNPLFKVACVISKKRIKEATGRNAIRRKILHALNGHVKTSTPKGLFVIYPKSLPKTTPYQKIEEEILKAFATLD